MPLLAAERVGKDYCADGEHRPGAVACTMLFKAHPDTQELYALPDRYELQGE